MIECVFAILFRANLRAGHGHSITIGGSGVGANRRPKSAMYHAATLPGLRWLRDRVRISKRNVWRKSTLETKDLQSIAGRPKAMRERGGAGTGAPRMPRRTESARCGTVRETPPAGRRNSATRRGRQPTDGAVARLGSWSSAARRGSIGEDGKRARCQCQN